MKIAVVGKGGSGKTTISALLARSLARDGWSVVALAVQHKQHILEAVQVRRQI